MRCKQAEQRLMESLTHIPEDLAGHLIDCPGCSRLRDDLDRIHGGLRDLRVPTPSDELLSRTRALCLAVLAESPEDPTLMKRKTASAPVPRWIWAALGALIILTGLIMIPGVGELLGRTRSLLSATVLTLLLQNAVTLILAPILLRACRNRRIRMEECPLNGSAP